MTIIKTLFATPLLVLWAACGMSAEQVVVKPTPEQAAWQDLEMGMFFHFDIITFTDLSEGAWQGAGHLDPNLYNPRKLSTDQWMEAVKAMGAKYSVFVAKHCTGFISWQSDAYPYGVRQSKWRGGKGDVVADYVASCRKYGVQPGLYCSMPANAYCNVFEKCTVQGSKGPNDPRQVEYRQRAQKMATELWGNYGPLTYIWFDGGVLPVAKGGADLAPIQRRLQPHAVTFGGPAENPAGLSRWVGNENGVTAYPNWSTVTHDNDEGAGNPNGLVWEPGECDAPLRDTWFWNPRNEKSIRSLDKLMDMYYKSVGRNANLILNASINRDGLVPDADMKRFKEFGDEIRRRFSKPIAQTTGEGTTVELDLGKPTTINHAIIMEKISEGERIREYVVQGFAGGTWKELCRGQSVGHKRIEQFANVEVSKIRLQVTQSIATPLIRQFAVYNVTPRPKEASAGNTAIVPVPKLENDSYDWYARHAAVLAAKKNFDPEIVLIGDSITHFWGGDRPKESIQRGPNAWNALFQGRRVMNLGFGWDRTQNVLWRLDHEEFDGLRPRYVVINIGTNNLTGTSHARENTPAEIAEGIAEICKRIRGKSAGSKIILMAVFPRGPSPGDPFRAKIVALNRLLAGYATASGITFLDLGPRFLQPDGSISAEIMNDGTHPTEKGYAIWADALRLVLK